MKTNPLISIVMSARNAATYLDASLDSVASSSIENFEFLVFNDASEDETESILDDWSRRDQRLKIFHRDEARGLAANLAEGVQMARGNFLARMDADDLCHPDRLVRQLDFLKANPDIALVGTWVQKIDEDGKCAGKLTPPPDPVGVDWELQLHPVFVHPSVMIRLDILKESGLNYDPDCGPGQDYELWSRLLEGRRGANLPESLMDYRVHSGAQTAARRHEQLAQHRMVSSTVIAGRYGPGVFSQEEHEALLAPVFNDKSFSNLAAQKRIAVATLRLLDQFTELRGLSRDEIEPVRLAATYFFYRFAFLRLDRVRFALFTRWLKKRDPFFAGARHLFSRWLAAGQESAWESRA